MKVNQSNLFSRAGTAVGIGLFAGLAGTAAITLSQAIEMKITKRKASAAPLKIAKEATGAVPANEQEKEKVSKEIHWAYGTLWGIARGIIGLTGLYGLGASAVHFASVWGTAMVMLPAFKASPPITEQEPGAVAIDGLHHAVYALAAGAVFDALDAGSRNQRRYETMLRKIIAWKDLKRKLGVQL